MAYKLLIVIPILLLVVGIGILVNGYLETGEWFERSIDLKGGTAITLQDVSPDQIDLPEARVREVGGFTGTGVLIETDLPPEEILALLAAQGVSTQDARVQTVGPSLGAAFWTQAQIGLILAFIFMGIVVFILFRRLVPSFAVIFAAVSDIIVTLAFMQLFGIPLSLAGLAALLMLIGYSVDTDILLTSRMLRGEGTILERLKSAFATGMTMTITTVGVMIVIVLAGVSPVITQIATVLLIGLVIDVVNTWLMNAGILRWYMERRAVHA